MLTAMRKHVAAGALAPILLLGASVLARAATLDHTILFSEEDLSVADVSGYDVVTLQGCDVTREIGKPQLPVLVLTLALPAGAEPTGLEITGAESVELVRRFRPLPSQPPAILPIPGMDLPVWNSVGPDASVYGAEAPFPPVAAEIVSRGSLGGNTAVGLRVYPLQFIPRPGKLRFYRSIALRIHYDQAPVATTPDVREASQEAARAVVANPEDLRAARIHAALRSSRLDPGDYEYVIVAPSEYGAAFRPLVDWKTKKGVPATIVTTQWIDAAYAGVDAQQRIRSFIADARDAWGTVWILLGGDTNTVPARRAYAMTSEAGGHPDEDAIACDLYYGDLDGTWNADGDLTYGEIDDDVDLYPDVYVGRASVASAAQAEAFASKVIAYERGWSETFQRDMLMAAAILWSSPYTDSGIALNMIDREFVPPTYDPITKLYESLGNETTGAVIAALNEGKAHFLHSGHAWYTVMSCGTGYLQHWDVDALTNANEQPVVYSIGCWPAAFDLSEDCIAEHFIRNPGGGAVAFIGNSRYGWASPGNPGFGYSERFMQTFYELLFRQHTEHAGLTLAAAKARYIPLAQAENVYRWHEYEVNLLGDPEMPVWTDTPRPLTVVHPAAIVLGTSAFDVAVRSEDGPVENALVCVTNGADLYERGRTGPSGTVTLPIATAVPDSMIVTVTARDSRPYEASVRVDVQGTYLRPEGFTLSDTPGGNGDGLAGPGEVVGLTLEIRNFGTETATGVEATLSTNDAWVTVVLGSSFFGDIPGGAIATGLPAYTLSVAQGCPNGHVALVNVTATSNAGRSVWEGAVSLTIAAPILSAESYAVDDERGGDGDGVPEPGEAARLMIQITNEGLAAAQSPSALLSTDDPDIVVTGASVALPTIGPGARVQGVFDIAIATGCRVPSYPVFTVETTSNGVSRTDTLVVAVGSAGFSDDFESGAPGWSHEGTGDLWTLQQHRSHSGTTGWYCGSKDTWQYQNGMNCSLTSPDCVLGSDTELSFWCRYEVPIYHQDGFFVELLSHGAPVDTLDFIGSGGALDVLGSIGNDWLEYRYALDGTPGDTVRIRFLFTSDAADVREGVYVDDVAVSVEPEPSGTGVPQGGTAQEPPAALHQNRPNPFGPSTVVGFSLREKREVLLAVYNIDGRLIRVLIAGEKEPGEHLAIWDGRDETGGDVAAGVYMCRLCVGDHEESRKMILVR